MRFLILLLSTAFLMTACGASYDQEKLYGNWKNKKWEITFNSDKTCSLNGKTGKFAPTMGNAIDIYFDDKDMGSLNNVTIKEVTDEQLHMIFRVTGSDKPQILKRVKK
ncbi:MAG: hypothetical protein MK212_13750 [Saprospiraceae bacterium]|nr:hypothetical protein [Saprospiraceae bacterium]